MHVQPARPLMPRPACPLAPPRPLALQEGTACPLVPPRPLALEGGQACPLAPPRPLALQEGHLEVVRVFTELATPPFRVDVNARDHMG